jgi:molecular chaperone DnaK
VDELIERCRPPVLQALKDAGVTAQQIDEVILVGGATRMPKVQELVRSIFGKEPHKGVNPDEVVAVGAAIQGAVLAGDVKDVVLLDVTPLSLGIETLGGVSTTLIPRNTTIPTRKSQVFSTASDSQTDVEVHVLQGERPMAQGNKTIGRFHLSGIPPAPRGMPQIDVTFDIDANGILHVSAKDRATNKEQSIRIEVSSGLNEQEIQRMVKDAESHAAEDRTRREAAEARNQADAMAYEAEKFVKEHGEKLDGALRSRLEESIPRVREALKGEDTAAITAATEALQQAWREAGEALHKAGQAQAPPEAEAGAASEKRDEKKGGDGPGGAVDADYEVIK